MAPNALINIILQFKIMLQKCEHIGTFWQQSTTSVHVDLGSGAKESLARHGGRTHIQITFGFAS